MWNSINDLLGPTIFHPQYFAKRGEYVCIHEVYTKGEGTFLDIGCGRQWYRPKLERKFKKYCALDHPDFKSEYASKYPIDLISDAEQIDLPEKSVDVVMMNLVIEHVKNPEKAVTEVKRILKKNGLCIMFAVENYPVHGARPPTFQHFTRAGLQELCTRQHFSILKIISFGNYWESVVTFQNVFLMEMVKKSIRVDVFVGAMLLCIFSPFMIMSNLLALIFGRKIPSKDFAIGHVFVLQN